MKRLVFHVILSSVLFSLCGCASSRRVTKSSEIEHHDSTRIEYRERIVLVPDTVFIKIPAQTAERTTPDSTSHLENEYAVSDAGINPDGSLFHRLNTKPQKKPVPIERPVEYRDRTVYRDRKIKVAVPVERNLTWWQATCIKVFPWALIIITGRICLLFRKPASRFLRWILDLLSN